MLGRGWMSPCILVFNRFCSVFESSIFRGALFLLLVSNSFFGFAQLTNGQTDPDLEWNRAWKDFDNLQYRSAYERFNGILLSPNLSETRKEQALLMKGIAAHRSGSRSTEFLLLDFIAKYATGQYAAKARLELGSYYFKSKKYRNAVRVFELTDVYYFPVQVQEDFYYRAGYAYFSLHDYENAALHFYRLSNAASDISIPANYYFGHIAYNDKNYETALNAFLKIKDTPAYKSVVPYYIVQIYFLQGRFDELIAYSVPFLPAADTENAMEINHMIGEAYFRKKQFSQALPFLKRFVDGGEKVTRQDHYQLGYTLYQVGYFDEAVKHLQKAQNIDDALAQNAYYLVGASFIKMANKPNARNAFRLASKMEYDSEVRENSLFSFALLSYELSIQTDAVDAFLRFKKIFPKSARLEEVNRHLASIFLTTRNYKDALAAMEEINLNNPTLKAAFQRASYFRGIEFFNDVRYPLAIELFNKSLKHQEDPELAALAKYWKAEASYHMKDFSEALLAYREFQFSPMAGGLDVYNLSHYNIAYCYYNRDDFSNASTWFRKFINAEKGSERPSDKARIDDALLRLADLSFVERDFSDAAGNYRRAIQNRSVSSDYAWFQLGMIEGLQQNNNEKLKCMRMVIDSFPQSSLFDDALFELAQTFVHASQPDKALVLFNQLLAIGPKTNFQARSLLGIGLIQYNANKDGEAMDLYKKVVAEFPGSPESRTALQGIKNIYVEMGNAEEFLRYAAAIPFADLSKASEDSLTYESAESVYMRGDCAKAKDGFSKYLRHFPNGVFFMNALFYQSECEFRDGDGARAHEGYKTIIASPKSIFTETSLLRSSHLYFKERNFEQALTHFSQLRNSAEVKANRIEGLSGEMRCRFALKKYSEALESAKALMEAEKISPELLSESRLLAGKSALLHAIPDTVSSLQFLDPVSHESSERGAEAKYFMARIFHAKGKTPDARKIILDLGSQIPSYDDWVARGFVLLAETYVADKDFFQAKATLESVISNYEGDDPGIVPAALDLMNKILEAERPAAPLVIPEIQESFQDTLTEPTSPGDDD